MKNLTTLERRRLKYIHKGTWLEELVDELDDDFFIEPPEPKPQPKPTLIEKILIEREHRQTMDKLYEGKEKDTYYEVSCEISIEREKKVLKYIELMEQQFQSDILRARAYPMTEYIKFTGNVACCPWHKEKTPSLHYYEATNTAFCFGACGRAYDVIDAVMLEYSLSFPLAVKRILNK